MGNEILTVQRRAIQVGRATIAVESVREILVQSQTVAIIVTDETVYSASPSPGEKPHQLRDRIVALLDWNIVGDFA